jgi:hypothetical protein
MPFINGQVVVLVMCSARGVVQVLPFQTTLIQVFVMDRSVGDTTILEGRLHGIEGRPPTPDPKTQPLNPRRELAACFHAYKKTYNEIEKLVRRMTSLKIYSCDEYEIYSGSNGFLIDWLDWDKISLALHSVELEVRRVDILQWVVTFTGHEYF